MKISLGYVLGRELAADTHKALGEKLAFVAASLVPVKSALHRHTHQEYKSFYYPIRLLCVRNTRSHFHNDPPFRRHIALLVAVEVADAEVLVAAAVGGTVKLRLIELPACEADDAEG